MLDPAPVAAATAISEALKLPIAERMDALAQVAQHWPRLLEAWAELGRGAAQQGHHIESYAYCRVGYHRGLDALRASGWRGSGYVRWDAATNRGFLWSLWGLQQAAVAIGEHDEADRCVQFLDQLDPGGSPPHADLHTPDA